MGTYQVLGFSSSLLSHDLSPEWVLFCFGSPKSKCFSFFSPRQKYIFLQLVWCLPECWHWVGAVGHECVKSHEVKNPKDKRNFFFCRFTSFNIKDLRRRSARLTNWPMKRRLVAGGRNPRRRKYLSPEWREVSWGLMRRLKLLWTEARRLSSRGVGAVLSRFPN